MFIQNTNTKGRQKRNTEWLEQAQGGELFYVYALTNLETGMVGYIGTTYDPHKRMQHHLSELKHYRNGNYTRNSLAKVQWMAAQPDTPVMKVLAVCTTRKDAELIERGLVWGLDLQGNHHPWKEKQEDVTDHGQTHFDDGLPFV